MALAEVQSFLARFLRDAEFRDRYRGGDKEVLEKEMGLGTDDVGLVRAINLDDLDRTATGFGEDRFSKRATEFQPFLTHLEAFAPIDLFAHGYDRAYRGGTMDQPSEMRNFVDFSTEFVLTSGLPDYLLELLRFSYHFCRIAVSARVDVAGTIEASTARLRASHRVALREPYRVVSFRYDVLTLAQGDPSPELVLLPPQPTTLFIQKDWALAKRAQVHHAESVPLLAELLGGEQLLLDLLAPWAAPLYPDVIETVADLHRRGVVHVVSG